MVTKRSKINYKKVKKVSEGIPQASPLSLWQKIVRWVGWGVVYVFVFYLGNVSGEYVATHMPILPSLPRISFHKEALQNIIPTFSVPNISLTWHWPSIFSKKASVKPDAPRTKLVILKGSFINVPQVGATRQEQETFVQTVKEKAVVSSDVRIDAQCEIDPTFFQVPAGRVVTLTNSMPNEWQIAMGKQQEVTLGSYKTLQVTLSDASGVYPFMCDGQVSGFYVIE